MAKEHESGGGKKSKKHLHHIRLEVTRDHKGKPTGVVEHHAYKAHPEDHHHEPERPMNVHKTPEEAAESAQDVLAQHMGGAGAPSGEGEEEAEAGAAQPGQGGGEPEEEA